MQPRALALKILQARRVAHRVHFLLQGPCLPVSHSLLEGGLQHVFEGADLTAQKDNFRFPLLQVPPQHVCAHLQTLLLCLAVHPLALPHLPLALSRLLPRRALSLPLGRRGTFLLPFSLDPVLSFLALGLHRLGPVSLPRLLSSLPFLVHRGPHHDRPHSLFLKHTRLLGQAQLQLLELPHHLPRLRVTYPLRVARLHLKLSASLLQLLGELGQHGHLDSLLIECGRQFVGLEAHVVELLRKVLLVLLRAHEGALALLSQQLPLPLLGHLQLGLRHLVSRAHVLQHEGRRTNLRTQPIYLSLNACQHTCPPALCLALLLERPASELPLLLVMSLRVV